MNLLNDIEVRIIGSLIEKEITTPEYYPLTINSLMNACNQKSNREPVVSYNEDTITNAVSELRDKKFITRVTGDNIRVPKYKQIFTFELNLSEPETAVITVLMLRGSQTPGEIKSRSTRLYDFNNLEEVEQTLNGLINREQSLIMKLPRRLGMKEARYAHLLSGEPEFPVDEKTDDIKENERVKFLEEEIAGIKYELELLKNQFEKFKKQFE